jgi:DNA-binding HxlR family transcriptional regulator
MDEDVKQLILTSAAETRRHFDVVAEDMRRHVDAAAEETRRHVDGAAEVTRRHFDIVAEELKQHVQLALEGVSANSARIDQLREEIKEEFVELSSMIRISYAQLDRRLRTLEEIVSGLLTRVDRLESAPTQ